MIPDLPRPESVSMDAITSQIYQGSRPPPGTFLRDRGFHMVVFCAHEFQPHEIIYPHIEVIRAYLDDSGTPMTSTEWRAACDASKHVARAVRDGRRVYVSCHMGQNRSGLVSALSLVRLTGMSGIEAVSRVKSARPYALGNTYFTAALSRIKSQREMRPRPGDVLRARGRQAAAFRGRA